MLLDYFVAVYFLKTAASTMTHSFANTLLPIQYSLLHYLRKAYHHILLAFLHQSLTYILNYKIEKLFVIVFFSCVFFFSANTFSTYVLATACILDFSYLYLSTPSQTNAKLWGIYLFSYNSLSNQRKKMSSAQYRTH